MDEKKTTKGGGKKMGKKRIGIGIMVERKKKRKGITNQMPKMGWLFSLFTHKTLGGR